MLNNDRVQGILFDANEKVVFGNGKQIHQKAMDIIIRLKKLQKSAKQKRNSRSNVPVIPYLGDNDLYELSLTEKLAILNRDRSARS